MVQAQACTSRRGSIHTFGEFGIGLIAFYPSGIYSAKIYTNSSQSPQGRMKEFPPFRLDFVNQCLWRRGDGADEQRIPLTPKAFAMLRYLVEHTGRLVTQDELLDAVWPDTFVQPEVLKSHIKDIRSALEDDAKNARFIETLPRRGYRFIAPVTDELGKTSREVDSPASRLVGRNTELDQLRGSLRRALHGERQLVFVTGEPGIGKTALVDAFEHQAAADTPAPPHSPRTMRGRLRRPGALLSDAGRAGPVMPWLGGRLGSAGFGCASADVAGAVSRVDEARAAGQAAA